LTKPKAKEQRFYCCSSSQCHSEAWTRGERKILTLVQKKKKTKEEEKSIYQTGARDRVELAVRCEHLLHVEGLTVTLR
jgi:hypothetical protein